MEPVFFETPDQFRQWLEAHYAAEQELLVGFYKTNSGKPSITWPESVDEALCFGWIDGRRKRVDDLSYSIRFTPRKARSIWSAVNIKRVVDLISLGRMQPSGLKAFQERSEDRSGIYAYEQTGQPELDNAMEVQFRAHEKAWDFFQSQAAWYRKTALWWVVSAKREQTKTKRLATLIDDSAHGRTVAHLTRTPGKAEDTGR